VSNLNIISISSSVIEKATLLRVSYNLRTPNTLQAASALTCAEDGAIFLTGDPSFKKIDGLEVVLI
jgi:hypothetical protein